MPPASGTTMREAGSRRISRASSIASSSASFTASGKQSRASCSVVGLDIKAQRQHAARGQELGLSGKQHGPRRIDRAIDGHRRQPPQGAGTPVGEHLLAVQARGVKFDFRKFGLLGHVSLDVRTVLDHCNSRCRASIKGRSASRMSSPSSCAAGTHLSAWPSRPRGSPAKSRTIQKDELHRLGRGRHGSGAGRTAASRTSTPSSSAQLAHERLRFALRGADLAARELPATGHVPRSGALRDQDPAARIAQRAGHHQQGGGARSRYCRTGRRDSA